MSEYLVEIRFADIDAMGHVNNSVYFTYLEQARIHYFNHHLHKSWNWQESGLLVAKNEMDYIKPIVLTDSATIQTRCTHVGTKSFTLSYKITCRGELRAKGKSVLVCYNHRTVNTETIPDTWRAFLMSDMETGEHP